MAKHKATQLLITNVMSLVSKVECFNFRNVNTYIKRLFLIVSVVSGYLNAHIISRTVSLFCFQIIKQNCTRNKLTDIHFAFWNIYLFYFIWIYRFNKHNKLFIKINIGKIIFTLTKYNIGKLFSTRDMINYKN